MFEVMVHSPSLDDREQRVCVTKTQEEAERIANYGNKVFEHYANHIQLKDKDTYLLENYFDARPISCVRINEGIQCVHQVFYYNFWQVFEEVIKQ